MTPVAYDRGSARPTYEGSGRPAPSTLPSGCRLRHPTAVDLPAIQRLVDDCESLDCDESRRSDWNATASFAVPASAPHENWWLLERDCKALGFARVVPEEPGEAMGELFVAAAERGRGLSAQLVAAVQLYGAAGMSVWRSLGLYRIDVRPSGDDGSPSATTA